MKNQRRRSFTNTTVAIKVEEASHNLLRVWLIHYLVYNCHIYSFRSVCLVTCKSITCKKNFGEPVKPKVFGGDHEKTTRFIGEPTKQTDHNSWNYSEIPKWILGSGCRYRGSIEPLYFLVFVLWFCLLYFVYASIVCLIKVEV